MVISTLVILVSILIPVVYFLSKWKFSYWKNKKVFNVEPKLFFGNMGPVIKKEKAFFQVYDDIYREAKALGKKYCGYYAFWTPNFMPIDPSLIKRILLIDFDHFVNHGVFVDEENDPLTGHLFALENEKWKNLRSKLTPTFTSGKMKMMFQTLVDCSEGLKIMLKDASNARDPIDIKDILCRFTTDVIGSVAFGLDINSINNPNSEFRKYGDKIFESSLRTRMVFTLINLLPYSWLRKVGFRNFEKGVENFFLKISKETVDYREKNNIHRKDFLHLLIQLKNTGKIGDYDQNILIKKSTTQYLTDNEMAAQMFIFFIAGYETSASTMTFALLELAQNENVQEVLRKEINNVLLKYDNQITYDAVMEMQYLEKVILESLRLHPPVPHIIRVCNKSYKVPDTDLVIERGTFVKIPSFAIHRDADYYPDPNKFDPERFNQENKASRPEFTYLPFGDGPRACIGLRFGKLQAKIGLITILRNYQVKLNKKTQLPIRYDNGLIYSARDGVWLDLEPIV